MLTRKWNVTKLLGNVYISMKLSQREMCIVFVYANGNPLPGGYKLIVASNRDEFYARPAAPVAQWTDYPHTFGGVDMEPGREGGTWLAISGKDKVLKVGVLLNITGEGRTKDALGITDKNLSKSQLKMNQSKLIQELHLDELIGTRSNAMGYIRSSHNPIIHDLQKRFNVQLKNHVSNTEKFKTFQDYLKAIIIKGRGTLVTDYVTGNKSNESYINEMLSNHCVYNPNNFVAIEIGEKKTAIIHCSNAPCEKHYWPEAIPLGFSNSPYNTPFQKVIYGQDVFGKVIEQSKGDKMELMKGCMNLLKDPKKCWPDEELMVRAPNWGEDLSSVCVKILKAGYGTRTRSVILVDWENKMDYFEETMKTEDPSGEWKMTHIQHQF